MTRDAAEVLALIPARGGSKGLPRKNLRLLAGKPLVVHSIEQALQSSWITRVVVSTDDPEIADVARQAGAEVPFLRPAALAQDETPDWPVFHHALEWLDMQARYHPTLVVHLRPTTPIRRVEVMEEAICAFQQHTDADSLRSISPACYSPYKMWVMNATGWLEPVALPPGQREPGNTPRQALPPAYQGNGYIDITHPEVILTLKSMTGRRILPFLIHESCVDIDDQRDLELAERLMACGTR
ncbi:MAG TPA: acylneuraminate cytidylyltransferase family protein [Candidatus Omnitrophica bacterium]|nr:acylneuraminate cytidylyltransferase family protein [Candidatus Omnitrophota bacterium]